MLAPLPDFDDPNFDKSAIALEDDSPYPEVRSAVANTDDPSMPSSTIRSWTIGLIFAIVMSGLNQFFFFRYPSVTIGNVRLLLFRCMPVSACLSLPPLILMAGRMAGH